jgi:two-component system response regulator VicR
MACETVLIVDDDPVIQRLLGKVLTSNQLKSEAVSSGEEALFALRRRTYDLILLDITMGGMDGFQFLEKIRRSRNLTPVIIVSGKNEDYDTLYGLELGADDYITKPFSMRELLARVKANIRRMSMVPAGKGAAASTNRMELGRVTVDTDQMAVLKDGQPLQLSQREYDLIRFLAAQPGKVFSREALMEHVWDYEGYVGDVRAVDVAVRRLREKIEDDPASPKFVVTKRGMGYYFGG